MGLIDSMLDTRKNVQQKTLQSGPALGGEASSATSPNNIIEKSDKMLEPRIHRTGFCTVASTFRRVVHWSIFLWHERYLTYGCRN